MKPVKIAMMSLTHGHTRKYFQTLAESPKLDWVAASAENEEVAGRFRRAVPDVPCYLDEGEMFDRHPEIEAAVLASANDRHLTQMEMCAGRGVHVLSMKIPSFDMAEYDRMIELFDAAGLVCQVELELHYNPVVKRIKKLLADGAVGPILSLQATNITLSPVWAFPWQGSPEASYGSRVPLAEGDSRFRGGALCDHPHVFDLIRWLTGGDFRPRVRRGGAQHANRPGGRGHAAGYRQDDRRRHVPVRPILVAAGGAAPRAGARLGGLPQADGGQPDDQRPAGHLDGRLLRAERLTTTGRPTTVTRCNTPTSTSGSAWSTSSSTACATAASRKSI